MAVPIYTYNIIYIGTCQAVRDISTLFEEIKHLTIPIPNGL